MYTLVELKNKTFGALKKIGYELNVLPAGDRRRRQSWIDALVNVNPPLLQLLEIVPAASVEQVQPIIETVEASPAMEAEPVEVPIESKFGRIVYPRPAQGAIAQVIQNSPGVESVELTQKAHEHKFLLCLKDGDKTLWYDGKDFVFEKWSAKTYCKRGVGAAKHQLRSHPEVKRAGNVLQAVENSPRVEVKPIEVQVQEPTIIQNEEARPQLDRTQSPDVHNQRSHPAKSDRDSSGAKTEALGSQEGNRVLAVARHCETSQRRVLPDQSTKLVNQPQDPIAQAGLYSPGVKTEATVSESVIAQAAECSITSANFTIPTFDAWCDRANRQTDTDEPPDTGIFVRLPKPKPPKFPPQAASQPLVNQVFRNYPETIPKLSRNYPETIPKLSRNYPETIPKLSRNYFIASSLAAAPIRADRLQEVMQCNVLTTCVKV
jgi:hypothetical protein